MRLNLPSKLILVAAALVGTAAFSWGAEIEEGFTSLFNGKTLNGWTLLGKHGDGYGVKDGVLYCAKGGGGNLLTKKEYSNFILRFEFRLEPAANNGIAIRAPTAAGSAAYGGMEIQVLEDTAAQYANLRPAQYHGSIYDVVPAKRGAQRPIGQWNEEEISANGRVIKVVLNGQTIVSTDLNTITDGPTLLKHPGLLRESGRIGFLGHNDFVEFRNIRVKELPAKQNDNTPPAGFTALFNGRDLDGWKGLFASPYDNPIKRAALSADQLAVKQKEADENMRAHWKVENGEIVFDGKGRSLCTVKDYGNFEMYVDWKIPPKGDSGIYLRGSPQVQIWDRAVGSGGLYNNKTNADNPLKVADKPVGEWNRFRILMVGEKVHVFLHGELVVQNTTLENYWDRKQPIFPTGQIELQNHGDHLWFKNIYLRELP